MSKISKLEKAFELFNNGEIKESEELLRNVILETAAEMNQSISDKDDLEEDMEKDQGEDLTKDISKDFDEIDAEETYDEAQDQDDDMSLDDAEDDLVLDLDGSDEEPAEIEDRVDSLEDEFADLRAEFDKLQAIEDEEHKDDEETHEEHDGLEEDFHLEPVKVDMKDKSKKAFSPVLDHNDKIVLDGEPVVTKKTDSAKSSKDVKVDHMKGGNTVKDGKEALIKEGKDLKSKIVKSAKNIK